MGLIGRIMTGLFGNHRNVIVETAEVFRENAEKASYRDAQTRDATVAQFAAEFRAYRGWFDQLIDGLNRLPRPLMAYGTLALFGAAMADPEWFASRMQGVILVPEPLWWLMGAVVSFYFGARHQAHAQSFQRSIAQSLARLPQVTQARQSAPVMPPHQSFALPKAANYSTGPNAALDEWRALQQQ